MKILFVAPIGSIHSQRWIKYFIDKGYDINILSTDNASDIEIDRENIYHIPLTGLRIPILKYFSRFKALLKKIKKMINDLEPDIIHAHCVNIYAYAFAKTSFHPYIVTPWGSDILLFPEKSLKRKHIVKYVIKNSDMLTCDATHLKEKIIQFGAEPEKVKIIYFLEIISCLF